MELNKVVAEINGETVGFFFGTYTSKLFLKEAKVEIEKIDRKNIDHMAIFLWACAQSYEKFFGGKKEVDPDMGYLYLDAIGKSEQSVVNDFFSELWGVPNVEVDAKEGVSEGKN